MRHALTWAESGKGKSLMAVGMDRDIENFAGLIELAWCKRHGDLLRISPLRMIWIRFKGCNLSPLWESTPSALEPF
jgi:hypothetical protein